MIAVAMAYCTCFNAELVFHEAPHRCHRIARFTEHPAIDREARVGKSLDGQPTGMTSCGAQEGKTKRLLCAGSISMKSSPGLPPIA